MTSLKITIDTIKSRLDKDNLITVQREGGYVEKLRITFY